MSTILSGQHVCVHYGTRLVVDDANFTLRGGEFTVLLGPNGAGKSSLMRAMAGLVAASGEVLLDGAPLRQMSPRDRARRIAYLPQGHQFHWPISVRDCIALGREPHADYFSRRSEEDLRKIDWAMAMTETQDFAERSVATLSGGERARVALARALATDAPVLLADEPAAGLDPRHQLILLELLRRLAGEGRAVLAILHDLPLASRFADRLVAINGGRIVADGPADAVLTDSLLSSVFGVTGEQIALAGQRITIPLRPDPP